MGKFGKWDASTNHHGGSVNELKSKKVAEMFDLSIDTLRYYERVGVIPPINRDENGYRNYTKGDLNWIFLAKSLRRAGLSVESLIEFATLAQFQSGELTDDTVEELWTIKNFKKE